MSLSPGEKAPTFARLGVGRLDATRLGYFNFVLVVLLNSGELSRDRIMRRTLEIVDVKQAPSTAQMKVDGDTVTYSILGTMVLGDTLGWTGGVVVTAGDQIEVAFGDSSNVRFAGRVLRSRRERGRGPTGEARSFWALECRDWTYDLDQGDLVLETYGADLPSNIVVDLISNYAPGFTTNNVHASASTVPQMEFRYLTLTEALNKLARQAGASWRVDERKDIHWWTGTTEPGVAEPQALNASNLRYGRLVFSATDIAQVRTRAFVIGRSTRLASDLGAGATTVEVEDAEVLDIPGTLLVGTDQFEATGATGNTLTGVDPSAITQAWGRGQEVHIVEIVDDITAQGILATSLGGSGIRPFKITDGRLSRSGAVERGQQDLAKFGQSARSGEVFESRDLNMRAGAPLSINFPLENAVGTFEIQKATLSMLAPGKPVTDVEFGPFRQDFFDLLRDVADPGKED